MLPALGILKEILVKNPGFNLTESTNYRSFGPCEIIVKKSSNTK